MFGYVLFELGKSLFCPFNDAFLGIIRQINEMGTIARHPDNEVGMVLRFDLRITKFLTVNYIELYVRNASFVPNLEIVGKEFLVSAFQELGHKSLVE